MHQRSLNLSGAATADPRAKPPAATSTHHLEPWGQPPPPTPFDGGIEELWVKLMGHLRDAANRLRVPQPSPPPPAAADDDKAREPTCRDGLRARVQGPASASTSRPATAASGRCSEAVEPATVDTAAPSRLHVVGGGGARAVLVPTLESAPFLVALTPEEIEEDIYAPPSPSLPSAPPSSSPSRRRPLPPVSATVLPPVACLPPARWLGEWSRG
ncbi:uncharacterized protein [Oryza sativa Japonica Group]|uniref:uncharacterized protein n=1 Tax=Oryza sativa subsp. japonica TaxID=39947 RepID=UPI00339BC308